MTPFLVIAHRGFSARHRENTPEAARAAVEAGADLVEADLRLSEDGALFCLHDADLRRIAGVNRSVAAMTAEEIEETAAAREGAIVRLGDIAAALDRRCGLLLDTKLAGDEMIEAAADILRPMRLAARTWFGLRHPAQVKTVRQLLPGARVLALMASPSDGALWKAAGADAIRLWEVDLPDWLARQPYAPADIWVTVGGAGTGRETGDIDPPHLVRLAAKGLGGALVNDPQAASTILARKELAR